jgi:hypothetical protein
MTEQLKVTSENTEVVDMEARRQAFLARKLTEINVGNEKSNNPMARLGESALDLVRKLAA